MWLVERGLWVAFGTLVAGRHTVDKKLWDRWIVIARWINCRALQMGLAVRSLDSGSGQARWGLIMKVVRMTSICASAIVFAGVLALGTTSASAGCVDKAAEATAESEKSAKWYALETMVQSVSWGLWPGYVTTGNVAGYVVKNKRYQCAPSSVGVKCRGQATFCKM